MVKNLQTFTSNVKTFKQKEEEEEEGRTQTEDSNNQSTVTSSTTEIWSVQPSTRLYMSD